MRREIDYTFTSMLSGHLKPGTWIATLLLLMLLQACNWTASDGEDSLVPAEPTQQSPQAPSSTVLADAAPELQFRELVLWTPEFFDPDEDSEAGAFLASVYAQFEEVHPDVRLEVQTKAEFGSANLFNYLRSTRQVVPSILPDIILIDTQQLWQITDLGMITPLAPDVLADLSDIYPFALNSVTYKNQLYGIPYVADVTHSIYWRSPLQQEDASVPTNWTELLNMDQPYLFPAGGRSGLSNDAVLLQYVGAGGQLTEEGRVSDIEALVEVFTFLTTGVERGVIPPGVIEYSSLSAVWAVFASAESGFANASAHRYLSERQKLNGLAFAPIPTRSGSPTTIGHVWAFAILSEAPEQHAFALEFIKYMLDPSIQGRWSQLANRLPTRLSSMETWEGDQEYNDFLRRLLDVAVDLPNGTAFAEFSTRLHLAQLAVINGELSPQEAATSVQPSP